MTPTLQHCAFKPCKCTLDPVHAVHRDGQAYCSERCADGRGCDHSHCNCGEYPEPEPDL